MQKSIRFSALLSYLVLLPLMFSSEGEAMGKMWLNGGWANTTISSPGPVGGHDAGVVSMADGPGGTPIAASNSTSQSISAAITETSTKPGRSEAGTAKAVSSSNLGTGSSTSRSTSPSGISASPQIHSTVGIPGKNELANGSSSSEAGSSLRSMTTTESFVTTTTSLTTRVTTTKTETTSAVRITTVPNQSRSSTSTAGHDEGIATTQKLTITTTTTERPISSSTSPSEEASSPSSSSSSASPGPRFSSSFSTMNQPSSPKPSLPITRFLIAGKPPTSTVPAPATTGATNPLGIGDIKPIQEDESLGMLASSAISVVDFTPPSISSVGGTSGVDSAAPGSGAETATIAAPNFVPSSSSSSSSDIASSAGALSEPPTATDGLELTNTATAAPSSTMSTGNTRPADVGTMTAPSVATVVPAAGGGDSLAKRAGPLWEPPLGLVLAVLLSLKPLLVYAAHCLLSAALALATFQISGHISAGVFV